MPLLLLPNLLGESPDPVSQFFPSSVDAAVQELDGLIAESEGGGRSYLEPFSPKKKPHLMPIALLNKNTPQDHLDFLLEPVVKGETWGIVSDAGLPCLADPGAALVLRAKQLNLSIRAFVGPSSIVLALMQSGLTGQRFVFHGYIGKEPLQRKKELQLWEKESKKEQMTHIFIEAPYRNNHTLQSCIETLDGHTLFCVASNLTLETQHIHTAPIHLWRKQPLRDLSKQPAVFLLSA